QKIFELIQKATSDCGRLVSDREIWDAINNSAPDPKATTNGKWPNLRKLPLPRESQYLRQFAKEHPFSICQLLAKSPTKSQRDLKPTEIFSDLFGSNAVLCVGDRAETSGFAYSVQDPRLDDPYWQFV